MERDRFPSELEERPNQPERDGGAPKPESAAPVTVKEAYTLLATARPAAILALLKQPDFAMIAGIAFIGFRVDPQALANPLVRRRLAEEAARNPEFAERLKEIAAEARNGSAPVSKPARAPAPAPKAAPAPEPDFEKYRAERDRLRAERDQALADKRTAEREYGDARSAQVAAQAARASAEQEAERLRQRLERLERRFRRLESEAAALRRATVRPSIPEGARAEQAARDEPVRDAARESERRFAGAVRRLLDHEKWAIAAQIASDVLRTAPDDAEALAIRARALVGQRNVKDALVDLRRLVPAQIGEGDIAHAADSLGQLLTLAPRPASEGKLIRDVYSALATKPAEIDLVRESFQRLRVGEPPVYRLLADYAPAGLSDRLFGEDQGRELAAGDPLPLAPGPLHGITVSARRLIAAIDANDTDLVTAARAAAEPLSEDAQAQVRNGLQAAGGDPSYALLLFRPKLAGTAIVDASNVAWHGQEMIVGGRPRLSHILAIRRALHERGFFPVLLIADANLPYVADDPAKIRQMARDGDLALAPGGSDADEHILREARRLSAPVITNDYMADWDPEQNVGKVQYDISLIDGRATLYF